jgi:predicted sulfurtransferase
MLKQRGVEDVSHLSGGIHRYVEKYGSDGFWKGKMFVFDQRVALDPDSMVPKNGNDGDKQEYGAIQEEKRCEDENIVGKCIECQTPYDRISGATFAQCVGISSSCAHPVRAP